MRHITVVSVTAWLGLVAGSAFGQDVSPDGAFELAKEVPAGVAALRANVRPDVGQAVRVHWDAMTAALAAAPMEDTDAAPITLTLPMPDGSWARFAVVESPVMHPDLAAVLPGVKTFAGQGLDDPASTVRLDYTPHGFHAQVFSEVGSWYMDPFSFEDTTIVASYWKRDLQPQGGWQCHEDELPEAAWTPGYVDRAIVTRRTYDLAVAGTGEYTAFHGGTAALGQAAIVTAVNRLNQIYERDLAVRFTLVANNINIVYTNAGTDPYLNNGSTTDLTNNQNNLTAVIGSANYDVGHLFGTGNGGVATLSSVCSAANKARGLSGFPSPVNDPFVIDYVAHELGHQFAGRHCFNNCGGSAGDSQTYAFEPGSGVTIMAYAGICGSTNVQSNSDAMFHSGSIDLMAAFVSGTTCDTELNSGNNTPTVSGGLDYTIPKQTPFTLTATGSDVDGDSVTYSWEQRDTAAGVVALGTDNGTNPIQRTWLPSSSPSRTIPRLSNLLANTFATGEILPQVARASLDYRVVARDNRSLNGGIATDNVVIVVNGTAGPFLVTSPNTNVAWSGVRTVTWNVSGTTAAPVSCANVKISLSTDGGNTWPTVLIASTPNDGTESVTLPSITTALARIKVEAVGNIFFDISNTNFSISPATGVAFGGTGVNGASDAAPNGNNNTRIEPGESNIAVTVQMQNSGAQTATGVIGTLTSLTGTVSVTAGMSAYPDMAVGVPQTNTAPFVIAVDPSHVCGNPINLRLSMNSAQGSGTYDFSLPTGTPGGSGTQTFSYTGPAVAIPENNPAGVSVPFTVAGFTGSLTDVDFRFDGTTCSATAGSTTVGLDHTYVGDLIVTLIAPGGSPSVVMIDRPGGNNNGGNNFCQTILDDEGTLGTIEAAAAASAPFSGSWVPNNPMSAFDGINPNGTWTLFVSDNANVDIGNIRAFSLLLTGTTSTTCQPPLSGGCDGDVNCDFALDGFDVETQEKAVGGDTTDYCQPDPDFNGDFALDGFDVEAVEIVVGGGPCP